MHKALLAKQGRHLTNSKKQNSEPHIFGFAMISAVSMVEAGTDGS